MNRLIFRTQQTLKNGWTNFITYIDVAIKNNKMNKQIINSEKSSNLKNHLQNA